MMATWLVVIMAAAAVTVAEDLDHPTLCQRVSNGSNVRHVGCISEALVPQNGTYEVLDSYNITVFVQSTVKYRNFGTK